MPKRDPVGAGNGKFGERLGKLRREAGYSQQELADELGVSRRMIAYYEKETAHPPSSFLVPLAKLLNVSADEILGIKPPQRTRPKRDERLWRRFHQIEKLPAKGRRALIGVIDTFLENAKLKSQQG